jgi:hypothetical protein
MPRAPHRVLARARQRVLGRHLGSDRVSAASRRVAAQGLVPHDRHRGRRRRDRRAHRVLPAGARPFSRRLGAVGTCALVATLLKNFAGYSAALAGYTVAIIASDQLGATGGPNGQAFIQNIEGAAAELDRSAIGKQLAAFR